MKLKKITERIKSSLKYYFALLFLSVLSVNAQERVVFSDNDGLVVKMNIPQKYKELKFDYEEGIGIIYGWEEGQIIQLIMGVLNRPPISDDDTILFKTEDSQKVIIKGFNKKNNRYWRHDNYKQIGLTVSFLNVLEVDTLKFELVLNQTKIEKKKCP